MWRLCLFVLKIVCRLITRLAMVGNLRIKFITSFQRLFCNSWMWGRNPYQQRSILRELQLWGRYSNSRRRHDGNRRCMWFVVYFGLSRNTLICVHFYLGMEDCQPFWISYQVLSVIASAMLGSTLIGKLIITLRAVLPQDKSLAIALELFFISLIVFVPGKMLYRYIASKYAKGRI